MKTFAPMICNRPGTLIVTAVTCVSLLAGCASAQKSSALDKSKQAIAEAKQQVAVTKNDEAGKYITAADAALAKSQHEQNLVDFFDAGSKADADHYAYVAEQNARTAQAIAAGDSSSAELAQLRQDRDKALAAKQERDAAEKQRLAQEEQQRLEQEKREAELAAALQRAEEAGAEVARSGGDINVTFRNVTFDVNKSTLKTEFEDQLKQIADALTARYPNAALTVRGHTDSTGSEQHNQALSEERAIAVKTFLVDQGLPADRVQGQGLGESAPVASNATSEGRAQNRRVELVISGQEPQ